MKKILYFLPFILGCTFYIIVSFLGTIDSFVWLALLMLLVSAILLNRNKWWGSFLGILIGSLLIYMGTQETGQIIKETPFGIIMIVYYIICGVISYRNK